MKKTKIRTAGDLWTLVKIVGIVLCFVSVPALFLARNVWATLIILALPLSYAFFALILTKKSGAAMMMNIISSSGVQNMHRGEPVCHMQWDEVGDFGIAEMSNGIFSGKYVYLSRVFLKPDIRQNIIKKYDPRVCIVLPCTDQVCQSLKAASNGRVDIR